MQKQDLRLDSAPARPEPGFGNYDRRPAVAVPGAHTVWLDEAALARLGRGLEHGTVCIDCYPGVDVTGLIDSLRRAFPGAEVIDVEDVAARPEAEIGQIMAPWLTDDRVFGRLAHLPLAEFYDADRLNAIAEGIAPDRLTCLVGWGASLVNVPIDRLVIADLSRWEIQQRQRRGAANWRSSNHDEDPLRKYKRSYFIEWRTADDHKRSLWRDADYWLDSNDPARLKLVTADTVWAGLDEAVRRPFRLVPYFDPGSWGGQWMRTVCGLDSEPANFAWCFDCVPEENSLLLAVGDGERTDVVDIPASNLVFARSRELLGARTHARFGPEFPIRFDMLDTMDGGNLSLQVHPLTGYIQDHFNMHYTQDESYYILDARAGAEVYLGIRTEADPAEMLAALREAESGKAGFSAERFVNTFPAVKHDHFSIPAGTVHCSGANSMVLEISATPYIFTFKMWDWGRLGLDGKPRPINIDHAQQNIQWERNTEWVSENLLGDADQLGWGDGWREERTGLHELEFIEVRRHWITGTAPSDTRGTVHVKNLVEGAEAIVESPSGAFEPFVVHYAETFIVPASVGPYTVRPHGQSEGSEIGVLTAYVRDTETR